MSLVGDTVPEPAHRSPRQLTVELVTGSKIPVDLLCRAESLDTVNPFCRPAWWENWWRHLRPKGSELFLLTVSYGDELIGIAPWYTRRVFGFGRVVRFLGDGRACSDYTSIAAAPGRRADVWNEITNWVAAEAGKSWDTFILEGISAADEDFQAFSRQLSQQRILVNQRAMANTWRLALPATWEEYVELFSKQHRNRLRRTKREMLDSGRAILRRVECPEDFERGFGIQCRLHQIRRHRLGDVGCFADPRFELFLRDANQRFLQEGRLRLKWTEIDGEPVAFDSGYVHQDGVYVYQTAFDPARSELSPGRLHLQASILNAIEQGYRFFDFLRGDEPYKAHFRATPLGVLEARLVAARTSASLGYCVWKGQRRIKSKLRGLQEARSRQGQTKKADKVPATRLSGAEPTNVPHHHVRAQEPRRAQVRSTRWRDFREACSRFGVGRAVKGFAYRAARRFTGLRIVHLVSVKHTELSPAPALACGLECRWLTADEVRAYATDPANDLDASMAVRLERGRNFCHAIVDGARLANYSWYALDSIEPEHSLGIGLTLAQQTVYLYKAYTHPDYRGKRIHHAAVAQAMSFFTGQGILQLVAVIEYANWASLRSHARLGCRKVRRIVGFGYSPQRTRRNRPVVGDYGTIIVSPWPSSD